MYTGSGFSDWEIGDITVVVHEGIYHLFHLIIPNHDYIAHAVSSDGLSWKRVKNALFVGEPGEWDDDMLWTMHICKVGDGFNMYYTGLQRKDRGKVSRIGLAYSTDLLQWNKIRNDDFPIQPTSQHYETLSNNPRNWLSFRDPFRYDEGADAYLLLCSRAAFGPVSRRGCVGIIKLLDEGIAFQPTWLYPMVYDDIECPCLFKLNERYYLLGSIREDIKVRYWASKQLDGNYFSFQADVLLPQGNYAARIIADGDHLLVYNFFYANGKIDALRVLPPPKELATDAAGRLLLKSYYRWQAMAGKVKLQQEVNAVESLFGNSTGKMQIMPDEWLLSTQTGYEIFCFHHPCDSFIWEGNIGIDGIGKLGLVCDMDDLGNGYFISFDTLNGLVQIRAWGHNASNDKSNFIFNNLQANSFEINAKQTLHFRLIRYGHYIELSIDGVVKLTLIDYTFSHPRIGFYTASSAIRIFDMTLQTLPDPINEYASQENAAFGS